MTYRVAPGMKRCSACKLVKPMADFNSDKQRADGKSYLCFMCSRKSTRKWRLANLDRNRAQKRRQAKRDYLSDPEKYRRRSREYYASHATEKQQYSREYAKANPQKVKLLFASWHNANREYLTIYNRLHRHERTIKQTFSRHSLASYHVRALICQHSRLSAKDVPSELTDLVRQYMLNIRAIRMMSHNITEQIPEMVTQVLVQEMLESTRRVHGDNNG